MNNRMIYLGLTAFITSNLALIYKDYQQRYQFSEKENYPILQNFFKPIDEERIKKEKEFIKQFHDCKILAKVIFTNEDPLTKKVKIDVWQNYLHQLEDYSYRAPLRKPRDETQRYENKPYKFNHLTGEITQSDKPTKSNYTKTKKMSMTLISQTLKTPLIRNKTVAVAHNIDGCEIKAMIVRDTGTYHRQWVSTNLEKVKEYQRCLIYDSYRNIFDFTVRIAFYNHIHNEVLACLQRESLVGLIVYSTSDSTNDVFDILPLALKRQADVINKFNNQLPIAIYQQGFESWDGFFEDAYLTSYTPGKVQAFDEYKERLISLQQNNSNQQLNSLLKKDAIKEINSNLKEFSFFNTTKESKKTYHSIKNILENPLNYLEDEETMNEMHERFMTAYM